MKVYIGPYPPSRWNSRILENHLKKKYNDNYGWSAIDGQPLHPEDKTDRFFSFISDCLNWIYNISINFWLDKIWYKFFPSQNIKIRIDPYDTWNMCDTLAHIIHPMLIQLVKTSHSFPKIDLNDVPEELRKLDGHTHWLWVLDEMIHAFHTCIDEDWEGWVYKLRFTDKNIERYTEELERRDNGFRLFGKYYLNLWD
jgi:hypothetical protein